MNRFENRITELEIQTALQADLIDGLNTTVAKMQQILDFQQEQLKLLYQNIQNKESGGGAGAYVLANEKPPHY